MLSLMSMQMSIPKCRCICAEHRHPCCKTQELLCKFTKWYLVNFLSLHCVLEVTHCDTRPTNHNLTSGHWGICKQVTTFFPIHQLPQTSIQKEAIIVKKAVWKIRNKSLSKGGKQSFWCKSSYKFLKEPRRIAKN
jgi:hypothetical protein